MRFFLTFWNNVFQHLRLGVLLSAHLHYKEDSQDSHTSLFSESFQMVRWYTETCVFDGTILTFVRATTPKSHKSLCICKSFHRHHRVHQNDPEKITEITKMNHFHHFHYHCFPDWFHDHGFFFCDGCDQAVTSIVFKRKPHDQGV